MQKGAEAVYSPKGQEQVSGLISHYLGNAAILAESLRSTGLSVFGGVNAPYIWVEVPPGYTSWQIFDKMLRDIQVVITPGVGFGSPRRRFFSGLRLQLAR